MKAPRVPRRGSLKMQCPVCSWADEVKEVEIDWWDGEDWSWEHPSYPGEWERVGGCDHLEHWDKFTREEQAKIKGAVWDEITQWKKDYLADWADRAYDEARENKRLRAEFPDD